jgi:hypothetical protein
MLFSITDEHTLDAAIGNLRGAFVLNFDSAHLTPSSSVLGPLGVGHSEVFVPGCEAPIALYYASAIGIRYIGKGLVVQ